MESNNLEQIWITLKNALKTNIEDEAFKNNYLESCELIKVNEESVYFLVKPAYLKQLFERTVSEDFKLAVKNYFESNKIVHFVDSYSDIESIEKNTDKQSVLKVVRDSNLNSKMTFTSFVRTSSSESIYDAAYSVAVHPASQWNPLYIYGDSGLGKTHLLNAIGNKIKEQLKGYKVIYFTSDTFSREFVKSLETKNLSQDYRDYLEKFDVFLIDDIQQLSGKEKSTELFFNVFNYFVNEKKQVVVASDQSPHDLAKFEERLKSRFQQGLVLNIKKPDFESAKKILIYKLKEEHLELSEDVITFISETYVENIRSLEGVINKIKFLTINGLKSIELDKKQLEKELSVFKKKMPSLVIDKENIAQIICEFFNFSLKDVKKSTKVTRVTEARSICFYFIKKYIRNTTLSDMGKFLGNLKHSAVGISIKKIEDKINNNPQFKIVMEKIEKIIESN